MYVAGPGQMDILLSPKGEIIIEFLREPFIFLLLSKDHVYAGP